MVIEQVKVFSHPENKLVSRKSIQQPLREVLS